jgi:3-phenylpropionate/trans-cinnamate dioxygenase ferredoxin reductase subunit
VLIVGAGWIGLEVAAAARLAGTDVTILGAAELPLLPVLGPQVAPVFADLHREHGVDLRLGVQVAEITGSGGRATGALLADGTRIEADAVIVGIGAVPRTELAADAGLDVRDGVVTDASLRSSDPGIYAAGDIACAFHPLLGRHIRVEHWANALHQPDTAARAMLGQDASYDNVPYFFTDQYDLGMEYAGYAGPGGYDEVVLRGDVAGREFVAFWLSAGRVVAGMNVNVWDVTDPIQDLIRSGKAADRARLADPAVPIGELIPPG